MVKENKDKEIAKIIGAKIKQLRNSQGLTQEQLSEKMRIDSKHLSRIETGISLPNIILTSQLINFFNFNFLDLIENSAVCKIEQPDNIQIQSLNILNSAQSKQEKACYLEAIKHTQKCLKLGNNREQ